MPQVGSYVVTYLRPVGICGPATGVGDNIALVPPLQPVVEGDAFGADENVTLDAVYQAADMPVGIGKTQYQAYQAIITNGTVYVFAFIAYLTGLWTPTFLSIMILFGIGIIVDSLLTVYYAFKVLFPKIKK